MVSPHRHPPCRVDCVDGMLCLNGEVVFQRLVLDQGFYPDGIYTAPTAAALEADIDRALAMGFNGARLHQKVFEPYFLTLCDRKGYLVWGEHGNWGLDVSRPTAWRGFIPEWCEILERESTTPPSWDGVPSTRPRTSKTKTLSARLRR